MAKTGVRVPRVLQDQCDEHAIPPSDGSPLICAVGDLFEDIVVAPRLPTPHDDEGAASIVRRRGGSAANVAANASSGGCRGRFVGVVGEDQTGDRLLADLEKAGVDACVARTGRTGCVVVLLDGDDRRMYSDRPNGDDSARFEHRWLDDVKALHLSAFSLLPNGHAAAVLDFAAFAKRLGISISLGVGSVRVIDAIGRDVFSNLIAHVGVSTMFCNERENRALLDLHISLPSGASTLVVTGGASRATATSNGNLLAAADPRAVGAAPDTTGAGDAFAAGFIAKRLLGGTPMSCLVDGHACAYRLIRRRRETSFQA